MSDDQSNLPQFPGDMTDATEVESKNNQLPSEGAWTAIRHAWPTYAIFAVVFGSLAFTAIAFAVGGLYIIAIVVGFVTLCGIIRMILAGEVAETWKASFGRKRSDK
jgi:hypothetical protein